MDESANSPRKKIAGALGGLFLLGFLRRWRKRRQAKKAESRFEAGLGRAQELGREAAEFGRDTVKKTRKVSRRVAKRARRQGKKAARKAKEWAVRAEHLAAKAERRI